MSKRHLTCSAFRNFALTLILLVGCCALLNGLQAQQLSTLDTKAQQANSGEIQSVLSKQAEAWNEGNLDKFMETYWNSERLTFSSGGKTTRGWQATLDRYKKNYTPEKMGKLHFTGLEITLLESRNALVLGEWHLRMQDGSKADGNFSLVMTQMDGRWKIIHDHSSLLKE